MQLERYLPGSSPLLINVPHAGTWLADTVRSRLTPEALELPDTDWYVDELYDFAPALGAGLMSATASRYLVDLNRPPDDAPLYAGQGTGLVPLETFSGQPVYAAKPPDAAECASRAVSYWQPYHAKLAQRLAELRDIHGHVILLDAHSIASRIERLFSGELPALSLGSAEGRSADASLVRLASNALSEFPTHDVVVDQRFKGGYITRHYGQPQQGIHVLQLEMAQRVYMHETPPARDPQRWLATRTQLRKLVQALLSWSPA